MRLHRQHTDPPSSGPTNGLAGSEQGNPTTQPEANTAAALAILPLLLSLAQGSVLLGVSTRTLKRMAAADELPEGAVVRIGRRRLLSRLVLEEWCRRGCPPPPGRTRKPR